MQVANRRCWAARARRASSTPVVQLALLRRLSVSAHPTYAVTAFNRAPDDDAAPPRRRSTVHGDAEAVAAIAALLRLDDVAAAHRGSKSRLASTSSYGERELSRVGLRRCGGRVAPRDHGGTALSHITCSPRLEVAVDVALPVRVADRSRGFPMTTRVGSVRSRLVDEAAVDPAARCSPVSEDVAVLGVGGQPLALARTSERVAKGRDVRSYDADVVGVLHRDL